MKRTKGITRKKRLRTRSPVNAEPVRKKRTRKPPVNASVKLKSKRKRKVDPSKRFRCSNHKNCWMGRHYNCYHMKTHTFDQTCLSGNFCSLMKIGDCFCEIVVKDVKVNR